MKRLATGKRIMTGIAALAIGAAGFGAGYFSAPNTSRVKELKAETNRMSNLYMMMVNHHAGFLYHLPNSEKCLDNIGENYTLGYFEPFNQFRENWLLEDLKKYYKPENKQ